jgi:hypothetical protein
MYCSMYVVRQSGFRGRRCVRSVDERDTRRACRRDLESPGWSCNKARRHYRRGPEKETRDCRRGQAKKETTLRDMRGRLRGGREREILICGRHFRAAQHTAWLAVAGRAGKRGWRGGGHVSCHFSHHTFSAGGSDRCINVVDPREVESPAVHGFNGIPIPSSCLTPLFKKR